MTPSQNMGNPNASWGGSVVGSLAPGQNQSVQAMIAKLAGQGIGLANQANQQSLSNQGNQMSNQMSQQILQGMQAQGLQNTANLVPQAPSTNTTALSTPGTAMPTFSQLPPQQNQNPNPFAVSGQ